jgi:hypothetical protein
MLTVASLAIGLVVVVGMAGFTFNSLLFQRAHAEAQADAMALGLAADINEADRVGQMNELQAGSRELVYVSRQQSRACSQDEQYDFLAPLCQQLLFEARDGQRLVDTERMTLAKRITRDLQQAALAHNFQASVRQSFATPWLQVDNFQIDKVQVGYVENIDSNIKDLGAIEELADFDKRRGYIAGDSKFYRGNINASLPDVDSDLCFKFSSLPGYVEETSSPARNTNPGVFVPIVTVFENGQPKLAVADQIPNAVQITCSVNTLVGLRDRLQAQLGLVSTGVTNGAIAGAE